MMSSWPGPRRWDPFRDLQREVGRLLQTLEPIPSWRSPRPFPAINLYDAGDRYILTADLPGMAPDELDLSLTGETLTLRGERRRPEGVNDESYRRQERPFGRWSRSVTLPERIDAAGVSAQCSQGVLVVHLPKSEDVKPRQIPVTSTSS
jgi:HSP20 family protein